MPFRHVSLFRWKPGTTPEQVAPIKPALDALATELAGVRSYACGPGLQLSPAGYEFGVVAEFEDRAAWDHYMANGEHDRIRSELIAPIVEERASFQLDG